jgi:hypothetical protein
MTRHAFVPRFATLDYNQRLREVAMFFRGADPVHQTMERLVGVLKAAQIPYCIMGGMAVVAHGYERTTDDVDILLTTDGLKAFRQLLAANEFETVPGFKRRFRDKSNGVSFDIMLAGRYPGSGKPGPIAFPSPQEACVVVNEHNVVNLPMLIQLKLAARRHQDFADVVNLIRHNNLDESYQDRLHPTVRSDYIECLEEKRREDEYAIRQDQDDE